MTVHASKGLEFPHVFVIEAASAATGRADLVPDSLVDADGVVHVALPRRDGRCERTPTLGQLREVDQVAEREESLRLWYVAMTRAQRRLYVSGRWDFTPTKGGKPRAMGGALRWLRDSLDLAEDFGGADRTYAALDGLIRVDTRPPREVPTSIWDVVDATHTLATPLELPPAHVEETNIDAVDSHALRAALRESVSSARSDEWRQLDGTRVHDAVARLLAAVRSGTGADVLLDPEHGPWLTDATRERLGPVVDSPVFRRLVELGATPEVPYVAGSGDVVGSRAVPGATVAATAAGCRRRCRPHRRARDPARRDMVGRRLEINAPDRSRRCLGPAWLAAHALCARRRRDRRARLHRHARAARPAGGCGVVEHHRRRRVDDRASLTLNPSDLATDSRARSRAGTRRTEASALCRSRAHGRSSCG
jgi:hypothetical protein